VVVHPKESDLIPDDFAKVLVQSWVTTGEELTSYRDFVAHIAALNRVSTWWMNPYDGQWGSMVAATKGSRVEVSHRCRLREWDRCALVYCHGVAADLINLSQTLMALPDIDFYLTNHRVIRLLWHSRRNQPSAKDFHRSSSIYADPSRLMRTSPAGTSRTVAMKSQAISSISPSCRAWVVSQG